MLKLNSLLYFSYSIDTEAVKQIITYDIIGLQEIKALYAYA